MPEHSWSLGKRQLSIDPTSKTVGSDVQELQTQLDSWGYRITTDGVYGPSTAARVREFQRDRGLHVDGIVGPLTISELLRVRQLVGGGRPTYLRRDPPHDGPQ